MKNKKSLGQHWLNNRAILDEIADEALGELSPQLCVEIGPGLGTLTSSLLRRFDKVIAVEFDENLANNLPKSFPGTNLEVVNEDILRFDFGNIKEPYAVAGNIPYYITSPIIEKLLNLDNPPLRIALLIQKEVAERILADKASVLSLMVKNRATVTPGIVVSRTEFTPPPKVDSATIILEPHPPMVGEAVIKLIQRGFVSPRKKLIHNLAPLTSKEKLLAIFGELKISVDSRPADLKLEDWQRLEVKLHQ